MNRNLRTVTATILSCAVLGMQALHADESDRLVKSIMKLRADVEALYTQIDDNKENYKAQMKSYAMQKADAQAQINRKETTLKQMRLQEEELRQKIAKLSHKNEDLKPLLIAAADRLKEQIAYGYPFKIKERTGELEKIKRDLQSGTITPEKALTLLWSAHDDAIRITRENGLFKQQIKVNGEEKLCQIAKIGTVMMFFSTPDDKVGYAVKKEGGYDFIVVEDKEDKKMIVALFDALQKQIRTGYFHLPNALLSMEGR